MDVSAAPPPEAASAAAAQGRDPLAAVRPPGGGADAALALGPFELLLQMLGSGLPGGESLPAGGDVLPAAGAQAVADDLDSAAPLFTALPFPVAPIPAPVVADAASGASASPASTGALEDALTLVSAGARSLQPEVVSSVDAGAVTAETPAASIASTEASAAEPILPQPAASTEAPADLDLSLLGVGAAAGGSAAAAAVSTNARASGTADLRRTSPAERAAQSVADALARADALAQPRTAALEPAATEVSNAAAFDLATMQGAAEPLIPTAAPSALSADSVSPFAPLASQGGVGASTVAGAAAPTAQLPPHLGAPVDANSARWHEALASRIQWLVDHEIGEARIKLNPPELGALDVKISLLDDKTYVQMTAHTSAARDELAQSLPRLRDLMSASGLDLGGATVSGGRDERSGYPSAAQPAAQPFAPDSPDLVADLPRLRLPSASRIDLFA